MLRFNDLRVDWTADAIRITACCERLRRKSLKLCGTNLLTPITTIGDARHGLESRNC